MRSCHADAASLVANRPSSSLCRFLACSVAVLLSFLSMMLGCSAHANAADDSWIPPTPAALLELLRAKDAQSDNLMVCFERRELIERSPAREWFEEQEHAAEQGRPTVPPLKAFPANYMVQVVRTESLTLRGGEVTIETVYDTDELGHPSALGKQPMVKRSNSTGVEEMITAVDDRRVLHRGSGPPNPVGFLQETAMLRKFALGIGFGDRITSITAVRPEQGLAVVEATMRLWRTDVTTVRLKLDRSLIVREARIHVNSDGDISEFELTTDGVFESRPGREIARTSQLKRTAMNGLRGSEKVERNSVVDHHLLKVLDVRFDLSQEEYDRLVKIVHSSATDIMDDEADASSPEPPRRAFRWLLVVNAIVVFVIASYLLRRQSRTRN